MTVHIVSIGRNYQTEQPCHIHVPAFSWPNPPQRMRGLNGLDPLVQKVVLHPLVLDHLQAVADHITYRAEVGGDTLVAVECNQGLHRSVAGGEWLAHRLRRSGHEVGLTHRDLEGATL